MLLRSRASSTGVIRALPWPPSRTNGVQHVREWQPPPNLTFAVQCGPRLIVDGKPLSFKPGRARRDGHGRPQFRGEGREGGRRLDVHAQLPVETEADPDHLVRRRGPTDHAFCRGEVARRERPPARGDRRQRCLVRADLLRAADRIGAVGEVGPDPDDLGGSRRVDPRDDAGDVIRTDASTAHATVDLHVEPQRAPAGAGATPGPPLQQAARAIDPGHADL